MNKLYDALILAAASMVASCANPSQDQQTPKQSADGTLVDQQPLHPQIKLPPASECSCPAPEPPKETEVFCSPKPWFTRDPDNLRLREITSYEARYVKTEDTCSIDINLFPKYDAGIGLYDCRWRVNGEYVFEGSGNYCPKVKPKSRLRCRDYNYALQEFTAPYRVSIPVRYNAKGLKTDQIIVDLTCPSDHGGDTIYKTSIPVPQQCIKKK